MKHTAKILVFSMLVLLSSVFIHSTATGQQKGLSSSAASALVQELVQSGKLTPQQAEEVKKALEEGRISPEALREMQEKGQLGTLTPAEIEEGKKLLEQKKLEAQPPKPEVEVRAEPGKEPPKAPERVEPEKKPEEPAETKEEEYFKKTPPPEKPELEIFGHKLFERPPSTFAPITAVPVSNDYVIGPGDEIVILMWGRLDATYTLVVDNEGVINFPRVGPLTVAGLTFGEVKKLIKVKGEAITGVNVNVSMGKLRTIQVFVLGEVKSPGLYTVSSLATVGNALLTSGGPTTLGSLRRIELKRQGKVMSAIDVYDFLLKGDISADIRLMPGDVIFVPQAGPLVWVSGNVKRPAVYELKDRKDLKTALDLGGGLKPRAYNQRIQIERAYENRKQVVVDISYEELKEKKIPLQDGDLIRVFSILPKVMNAVYLYGNVLRPGEYSWDPGLRVLDILPNVESLDLDTYFDYALIKRYRIEDMKAELIPFDLGRLLLQRDQAQNIALKPLDEVYVFHKRLFEDREYAVVKGEVRKPGRYFIEDMKIRDLILKAGDLTNDAYLPKAELIRIDEQRNRHTLYFDAAAAMAGDPMHNLQVEDEDTVIIHSLWEEQWKEFVEINGEVKNPGQYILTAGMRLRDLIFKAGSFTRDTYLKLGHVYRTDWRTKEVTIHTFNPEKALEGDPAHNLVLGDLDKVVMHSTWEYAEKYTVTITGRVNKPGEYPYATNMTVGDLILVAGNVKDAAYLDNAELIRFDIVQGKKVETSVLNFNVRLALAGDPAHNLTLQPLDVVNIKMIPDWWEKKRSVAITGEVYFPGTYSIRKDERLSDLIQRAGGFTEYAYLRGAVFTREEVRRVQQQRLNDLIKKMEIEIATFSSQEAQATLRPEDVAAQKQFLASERVLVEKMREARASGRVVVSLEKPGLLRGTSSDLVLEDMDELHIPQKSLTVNVLGAVYNPTALVYDEQNRKLAYYLARTGGPTANAEEGQIYVIRADGTVISKEGESWFGVSWSDEQHRWGFWGKFEDTKLYPGDTVLVPQKIVRPDWMRTTKDISQIIFQIGVTAGILIQQVF